MTNGQPLRRELTARALDALKQGQRLTDWGFDPDGELRGALKAADIRRSCETQLAALRVRKDVRTELLSHGRNSLIAGRYDHHQYLDEKREALALWGAAIAGWKAEAQR